jgi:hypothetical protein
LIGTNTIPIDDTSATLDTNPSIAKGTNLVEWGIVWQRAATPTNHDIRGAIMNWDGTINVPSFPIQSSNQDDDTNPDVSTRNDAGMYLVVFQHGAANDHDIYMQLMIGSGNAEYASLTGLETLAGAGNSAEDQIRPSTDSDGVVFIVAYAESYNGGVTGDYDPRVSTVSVAGGLMHLSESHQNFPGFGFDTTREDFPSVAAAGAADGADRRCFVVWQDATAGLEFGNIEGGLYDAGQYTSFCHAGSEPLMFDCPCFNPPSSWGRGCDNGVTGGAILTCSGLASLAADTMLLTSSSELANALSVFSQGDVVSNTFGIPFGQGMRCAGGSLKRLYTKTASGGVAVAPTGADPKIHARSASLGDVITAGSPRYYYTYYRQPTVLGGCPSFVTFNTTQTQMAIWAP